MIPSHSDSQPSTFSVSLSPQSTRAITDFTISVSGSSAPSTQKAEPGPSRWRTKEFMVYGVVFALVVPVMVWSPMRLSSSRSFHIHGSGNSSCEVHSESSELSSVREPTVPRMAFRTSSRAFACRLTCRAETKLRLTPFQ